MGVSPGVPRADGRLEHMRYDSCHPSTNFRSQSKNRRNRSGVNRQTMPYREDTDKKDQGWAFQPRGSTSPAPDEDSPAIMVVAAPAAGENSGTCKTPSK
jgi:hypothetical protein